MPKTTEILGRRLRILLAPWRLLASLRWLAGILRAIWRRRRAERGRLTVGVDAASLFEPLAGIGGYLYQLLSQLAQRQDLRLRLYGPEILNLPGGMAPAVPLPQGPAIEWVRYLGPGPPVLWAEGLTRWVQRLAPLLVAADGNRVLFAPNFLAPPHLLAAQGALVATVHDLAIEKVPAAVRPDSRRALAAGLARTFLAAAAVITPSEAVRGEIAAAGHFDRRRITAIHHGPGQVLGGAGDGQGDLATPANPLPSRYGLAVGTLEPRKNLPVLLAAWRSLCRRRPETPLLVLAGPYGWQAGELRRQVRRGEREGWLEHRGYVDKGELVALYRGAAVVAFPSLYEGFGLPALEALACGAPLVASDLPVLREVAGAAALFAPPEDPEAWAAALERVLTEAELAAALARRGRQRAAAFSWEKAAEETVAVWRRAASGSLAEGTS